MVLIGNDMFLFGNVMRSLCPYDICSLLRHPLWSLQTTSGYEGLRWVRQPHTSDGCIDCACTYLSHSSMVRLIGVTSPQQGPPLFIRVRSSPLPPVPARFSPLHPSTNKNLPFLNFQIAKPFQHCFRWIPTYRTASKKVFNDFQVEVSNAEMFFSSKVSKVGIPCVEIRKKACRR